MKLSDLMISLQNEELLSFVFSFIYLLLFVFVFIYLFDFLVLQQKGHGRMDGFKLKRTWIDWNVNGLIGSFVWLAEWRTGWRMAGWMVGVPLSEVSAVSCRCSAKQQNMENVFQNAFEID